MVTGRGGKASSKLHSDYFNVSDGGQGKGIYLDKVEWKIDDDKDDSMVESGRGLSGRNQWWKVIERTLWKKPMW